MISQKRKNHSAADADERRNNRGKKVNCVERKDENFS